MPLEIREEKNNFIVTNVNEIEVTDAQSASALYEKAIANKVTSNMPLNLQSSRSHIIFSITLEHIGKSITDSIKSKFLLVDLAGTDQTKVEGDSFTESIS